ncbi:hypothetical protein GGI1_15643, partial [Acidithiobacillus sp. GGI-221]
MLEDALNLVAKLDRIAVIGAPSVIPNRDMADFLSRKLAKSIAYHPDVRNVAYIRELMDNGFSKRNAQKIVWTARKLSRAIPVDASVIRAIPEAPAASGVQEKAIAAQPVPEKPDTSGATRCRGTIPISSPATNGSITNGRRRRK